MSSATEELRDAREANGELKTSLQVLGDKFTELSAAIRSGDRAQASKLIAFAIREIDAMHGYLSAAHDAHRALRRLVEGVEVNHG